MKVYMLTNSKGESYGGTQWREGVTHCSLDLIHLYEHPLLAVLLNPMYANFTNPILWEGEAEIVTNDNGLGLGAKEATTHQQIPLPRVTLEQRVTFGILCALEVYREKGWVKWAQGWLNGTNRSERTARAEERAAWVTEAASSAVSAAESAEAASSAAAWSVSRSAEAAKEVAEASAWAAGAAAESAGAAKRLLNLVALAQMAVARGGPLYCNGVKEAT
mgnify:CR=1 FL=1